MRRNVIAPPDLPDRDAWKALLTAADRSGLTLEDLIDGPAARGQADRPARDAPVRRAYEAGDRESAYPARRPPPPAASRPPADPDILSALDRVRAQLESLERRPSRPPVGRPAPSRDEAEDRGRPAAPPRARSTAAPQERVGDRAAAGLHAEIEGLRAGMAGLATRAEIAGVERAMRELSGAVGRGAGDGQAGALGAQVADLQRQVRRLSTDIPAGLHQTLQSALDRLDWKLDSAAATGVDGAAIAHLGEQVDDLRRLLGEMAEPARIERLSHDVAALTQQFAEMRSALEQSRAGPDLLTREIRDLRRRVERLTEQYDAKAVPDALAQLSGQVGEVQAWQERINPDLFASLKDSLEGAVEALRAVPPAGPAQDAVLQHIAEVKKQVRRLANQIDPAAFAAFREQLQALAGQLSTAPAAPLDAAALDPFVERLAVRLENLVEGRRTEVGDVAATLARIDDALRHIRSGDPGAVHGLLRDLENLVDAAHGPGGALDRIEQRVDAIAVRLDDEIRVEPVIDAVWQAVRQGIAELRDARADETGDASDALRRAVREGLADPSRPEPPEGGEILWRLEELKSLHADLEGTALETLDAVKSALEAIAGASARQPAAADPSWSARLDAAMRRLRGERAREAQDNAPDPVAPAFPAHAVRVPPDADPAEIRAAFISAARRAPPRGREEGEGESLGGRLKAGLKTHRRTAATGAVIAAVALGLAAVVASFAREALPDLFARRGGSAGASLAQPAPPVQPFAVARRDVSASPVARIEAAPSATPAPVVTSPAATPPVRIVQQAAPAAPPAAGDVSPNLPAALRQAALAGAPSALYEAALYAVDGRDMQKDPALGARLLERAAAAGYAPAQVYLGHLYERGVGVARDLAQAHDWYRRAAERGNARAMHNLAVLLTAGVNGRPNYTEALPWFRQAAELGLRDSQYNLAVILAWGVGTAKNLTEAYKWFTVVANQGDREAAARRDEVAAQLSPADLAAARSLAESWRPKSLDQAANPAAPASGAGQAANAGNGRG